MDRVVSRLDIKDWCDEFGPLENGSKHNQYVGSTDVDVSE